jgi:hypothetical protein
MENGNAERDKGIHLTRSEMAAARRQFIFCSHCSYLV